jgi:hypothetical protein
MLTTSGPMLQCSLSIDVVAFAASHKLDFYLHQLLVATLELTETPHHLRLVLLEDPLGRTGQIFFEVHTSLAAAEVAILRSHWHQELERICPTAVQVYFGLLLIRLRSFAPITGL